jgi:hypothetical protein
MSNDRLLPIKVVLKRDVDYIQPEPGGGSPAPLCNVTQELRDVLTV